VAQDVAGWWLGCRRAGWDVDMLAGTDQGSSLLHAAKISHWLSSHATQHDLWGERSGDRAAVHLGLHKRYGNRTWGWAR
jgi:hypothetical protein